MLINESNLRTLITRVIKESPALDDTNYTDIIKKASEDAVIAFEKKNKRLLDT